MAQLPTVDLSVEPLASRAALPVQPSGFSAWLVGYLSCFRSIQMAIILLSLMALGVFVGVMIPQDGLVETANIKAQFGTNYRWMKALGLFNVYSSYWFIALEVLFFFNLLFGSFKWLKPAFLSATRKEFCGPEHIKVSKNHFWFDVPRASMERLELVQHLRQILRKHHYGLHQRKDNGVLKLYAAKGNFARLGAVVVHTGILLLLLGCVYGALTGFMGQKLLSPGQQVALSPQTFDMFKPNMGVPFWLGSVPKLTVKVHDFDIRFYPSDPSIPQQYIADLELLDENGKRLKRESISVNHPMSWGDFTIYQATYAPTGRLMMTVDGKPQVMTINTRFQDRPISLTELGTPGDPRALIVFPFFVNQDPGVTENYVRVFLHDGKGFVGAAPGKMPHNLMLKVGQTGRLGDMTVGYTRPEIATGLQMKRAPETAWVYTAFTIIMVGSVMCVFAQRQLWLAVVPAQDGLSDRVYLHYKTNKARISFDRELAALKRELYEVLVLPSAASPAEEDGLDPSLAAPSPSRQPVGV